MSQAYLAAAWPLPLPMSHKMVLVVLADLADQHGRATPIVAEICQRGSMSDRTVQAALAALERSRIVQRQYQAGRPTTYQLTSPAAWDVLVSHAGAQKA